MELKIEPNSIKGFIEDKEGEALYQYALEYSKKGNCLEIGSYCGKSALYIGSAVKQNSKLLSGNINEYYSFKWNNIGTFFYKK